MASSSSRVLVLVLVLSAYATACGGSSSGPPTSPSLPSTPAPATWSISGIVSDAVTGAPIANASLAVASLPAATTDGSGRWQLQGDGASPGSTSLQATITAPGFYERQTRIEWRTGGRTDVALTLFPDHGPFSLDFFRMLARNGYDEPETLEPVHRWASNPNFYLNAFNPKTQQKLGPDDIQMIEQTIRAVIPQVTGGQLTVGEFEVGVTPHGARAGVVNISIIYEPDSDSCGTALVGANPGRITLNYEACQASWCRDSISPNVVAHEAGHAMGLWHVPEGVMTPFLEDCRGITFSEQEQLHARMAYLRPNGNRDVDMDPTSFQALLVDRPREVICHNAPR